MPVMSEKHFPNVAGFDDAPFARNHRGKVKLVGAVYASLRFDGVLIAEVEKDGFDSAERLIKMVGESKFSRHIQLVLLQGIAFAGFNVVDVFAFNERLGIPVLVVARKKPDMAAIQRALLSNIHAGNKKWAVMERLGAMEPMCGVFVQRVGISIDEAATVLKRFAVHGHIPEPLRVAHLIAGALTYGQSRGRV
jgi:hypothetical protein